MWWEIWKTWKTQKYICRVTWPIVSLSKCSWNIFEQVLKLGLTQLEKTIKTHCTHTLSSCTDHQHRLAWPRVDCRGFAIREAPFWNMLVLFGHCPNSLRPSPSVKRANVPQTILASPYTPRQPRKKSAPKPSWQAHGNNTNTFQKGASQSSEG